MHHTEIEAADWARRHRVLLKARRDDITPDGDERWTVSATTDRGRIEIQVTTDGSYEPTAFGQLFGVWADEEPSPEEFNATIAVLSEEAVADLASIVGWRVLPPPTAAGGEGEIARLE